jgi:hypothetical protein
LPYHVAIPWFIIAWSSKARMGFTFNGVYREALNADRSLPLRWSHLKRCVWKHARWIDQEFGGTLARLCHVCALDPAWLFHYPTDVRASADHLTTLLMVVAEERARFHDKYAQYHRQRMDDKRRGRLRAPQSYLQWLHAPDYYHPACTPLAPWRANGTYGYLNRAGAFAIAPQYTRAEPFIADHAFVHIGTQRLVINTAGQIIREMSALEYL